MYSTREVSKEVGGLGPIFPELIARWLAKQLDLCIVFVFRLPSDELCALGDHGCIILGIRTDEDLLKLIEADFAII